MGGDYSMLSDSVIDETPILTTKVSWTTKMIYSSFAAVEEPSHFGSAPNYTVPVPAILWLYMRIL